MSETTFLNFLPLAPAASPDTVEDSTPTEDWLTLACQMRSQNRELLKNVLRLERTVADSQQQLQSQLRRLQKAEILLCQQTDTLQQAQTQIADLNQELATCQEENQRQQLQIETLAEQLAASQERVAQLEGECVCLQQDCQERAEKLALAEGQVRQLQADRTFHGNETEVIDRQREIMRLGNEENLLATSLLLHPLVTTTPANWSEPILPPL